MSAENEYAALVKLIAWIDKHAAGLDLPSDERSLIAAGCFDVALEHQASIALLYYAQLPGSLLALLRILTESLTRGLWLLHCASDSELEKFKKGEIEKTFGELTVEFETKIGIEEGPLSGFKRSAWKAMNDFTHTGFIQVARRHSLGKVGANYDDDEIAKALGVAGALGLIAAGQMIGMSNRPDLGELFIMRMQDYANTSSSDNT